MTTIMLAPQTALKLTEMAIREGWDENTLADALLAEVLEARNQDFMETLKGIERGRQAYTEGRSRRLSECVSDVLQRRQERDAAHAKETNDRSWEIYFRLRPQIETPETIGKLLLLDLNSGDYEIANDELGFNAVATLRERHSDVDAFGMRIGYKTSVSFCGDLERLPE